MRLETSVCLILTSIRMFVSANELIADNPDTSSIVLGRWTDLAPPNGAMGVSPRLVKFRKGPSRGDLLLFYQSGFLGGDFWMYRSHDLGKSCTDPVQVNRQTGLWTFASCNVIQLEDGRLLMTMQRRIRSSNLARDYFIDVRFSSDGEYSWDQPFQAFADANREGRPIQVPHDADGDGNNDVYRFFTQRAVPTDVPDFMASRADDFGRAVAFVVSDDGGQI